MSRASWILTLTAVLALAVLVRYISSDSEPIATINTESPAAMPDEISAAANEHLEFEPWIDNTAPAAAQLTPTEVIAKWRATMSSADQNERDVASAALVKLPKEKVLPILHMLVVNGGVDDRQLALNGLRMIALKRGDEDGEIQNLLRLAIYDGDETLVGVAQLALEDIESVNERILLVNP